MSNLPKIIASDIDGTLTHSGHVIPEFTCNVLNHLASSGIPIALITGFNYLTTRKYIQNIDPNITVIVQNGTLCERNGEIVWEMGIAADDVAPIYRFLEEKQAPIIVYKGKNGDFKVLYKGRGEEKKRAYFNQVEEISSFEGITGISTLVPNELVPGLKSGLSSIIGDNYQLIYSEGKEESWLEVTPPAARKDMALDRLCRQLGLTPREAIYFGDNFNDLETLKMVGHPVVMENAVPSLRDQFDTRASVVYSQGAARYLVNLFQLKKFQSPNSNGFS